MVQNTFFSRIFFYTSLESIIYQALLCIHQIALFRTIDTNLYGQAGAIFSSIFLLVLYCNAGLDATLAPLFKQASQNKNNFVQLFFKQSLTIILTPIALLGIYFLFPTQLQNMSSPGIIAVCALLVLVESAKKTIRTVLHLALLQKTVALVEIATLFFYITCVWASIIYGKMINLYVIFIPMLITSSVSLLIYISYLYKFYFELSDTGFSDVCWKSVGLMRLKNWLYQTLHSLYSSNFLVLSIAQLYGFELAALLKVMSFCTYSINYIVQHTFGIASSVLFAHAKDATKSEKQQVFARMRTRLSYVLLACPVILLGYHWYLYIMHPDLCAEQIHITSLFMILLFSENIAVAHEQYFIVEGRSGYLIVCNLILLIPCITQHNLCTNSPAALLYLLLAIRIGNFLLLHYADHFVAFCEGKLQQKYNLLFAGK
jgi:hypothetical protein